jgi:hypothetical protein
MREKLHNLRAPPRAGVDAPALSDPPSACWNERELDLAAVRRWFIQRIARQAVAELKREERHVSRDG